MARLVEMVDDGAINKATGGRSAGGNVGDGRDPASIVEAKGLAQISDTAAVEAAVDKVLAANDGMVQEYLGGKDKLFGPLMGKAMAELKGKGNPAVVKEVLAKLLEAKRG